MADFSDQQDRLIVQFAHAQERAGATRLSWVSIAKKIKNKKPEQVRLRLATLKKRFGPHVAQFPRRYFDAPRNRVVPTTQVKSMYDKTATDMDVKSTNKNACSIKTLIDLFDVCDDDDEPSATLTDFIGFVDQPNERRRLNRRPKPAVVQKTPIAPDTSSLFVMLEVFKAVTKADVRQASGRIEHNVGELTYVGVREILRASAFTSDDVFVDVGAGVGNVIAHVALDSEVNASVGIEVRPDVARTGEQLIKKHSVKYPRLAAVHMFVADVRALPLDKLPLMRECTVLFSHNTLFVPEALIALENLCCHLPRIRIVILQQPFCHRHRPTCTREFCTLFRARQSPLAVSVTFTTTMTSLTVYDRL